MSWADLEEEVGPLMRQYVGTQLTELMWKRARTIDAACCQMLKDSLDGRKTWGVLVNGVDASIDPHVPVGEIWEVGWPGAERIRESMPLVPAGHLDPELQERMLRVLGRQV